jgi:hypothetical protein
MIILLDHEKLSRMYAQLYIPPEIPKVSPPEDQYIAVNSSDNVTYTCTANFPRSVLWILGNSNVDNLIRSNSEFDSIAADFGIYIEPPNPNSQISTITLTQMTWDFALENNFDIVPVACASTSDPVSLFDDLVVSLIHQAIIICK